MKIIKKWSDFIFEDGNRFGRPTSTSGNSGGTSGKTDTKTDTKADTKADSPAEAKPDESYKTKDPYKSLIKLPGAQSNEGLRVNGIEWPHAITWTTSGGQAYDASAKAPINTNKIYHFNIMGSEPEVTVQYQKAADYTPFLYSGTYAITGNKLTITGSTQSEVIDISTGKFDSSNVAVIPSTEEGVTKELSTMMAVFSRKTYSESTYGNMRMLNLKKEDPTLYKLLVDELKKKGYPDGKSKYTPINQTEMVVEVDFFKNRTDSYWPVVNKFYTQFAPGKTKVPFGSINSLSAPVHVDVTKGKRDFISGYEYLAYKLESADGTSHSAEHAEGNQSNFSFDEAICFYTILCGLSRSAVETLIKDTASFGVTFEGGLNWESNVLDEISGTGWYDFYNKVVKGLQANSGSVFTQESLRAMGKGSAEEQWFDSIIKINTFGGDYLKRALSMIPAYSEPVSSTYVAM